MDATRLEPVKERSKMVDGHLRFVRGAIDVPPDDVVAFLSAHRDPGLWHSVVSETNYDLAWPFETMTWMVVQPDCDLALATTIYARLLGPRYCGPSPGVAGMPVEVLPVLDNLSRRSSRTPTNFFYRGSRALGRALGLRDGPDRFRSQGYAYPDGIDPEALLRESRMSRRTLRWRERSAIAPPVSLLIERPNGTRTFGRFAVDETGILAVEAGRAIDWD